MNGLGTADSTLNILAQTATILMVLPVTFSAFVFLYRAFMGAFRYPKDLSLTWATVIGDPGFTVSVSNRGKETRLITDIGVIPTHFLPRFQITKIMSPGLEDAIKNYAVSRSISVGVSLKPGDRHQYLVPEPFDLPVERKADPHRHATYEVLCQRFREWARIRPLRLTSFATLADGTIVLGPTVKWVRTAGGGLAPYCKCNHHIGAHRVITAKRLTRGPRIGGCRECVCTVFEGDHDASMAHFDDELSDRANYGEI